MSEVPYTPLYNKMKEYFDKFQEVSIPEKVNRKWLNSIGFATGNDYYIVRVLKHIKLIDDSNIPTEFWRRYKNPIESRVVLAEAIRVGYGGLFKTYEDANRKDREAIYAFFSSKTGKAKSTINLMVNTFVNLCQLADFEAIPQVPKPELPTPEVTEKEVVRITPKKGIVPEIHLNIQLHLPPDVDPLVIENLFKSLKKHLLSAE